METVILSSLQSLNVSVRGHAAARLASRPGPCWPPSRWRSSSRRVGGLSAGPWREWRRAQLRYHVDAEREHREFEARLRQQLGDQRRAGGDKRAVSEATDRLFASLRNSDLAANSREVATWRGRSPSPERTAVALRWAETAVDEARYNAALHETWRRDYERGVTGHHITDDEVPPPRMPEGWTTADLLYGETGRKP